jgi:threonine/homoserine/homoserine lactone efflux protein
MDLGIIAASAMLVVWAVLTFVVNDAPGMTHALLIAGVTLLIWRVVKRGDNAASPAASDTHRPRK